jgi:outer membrane immunogenic protein
MIPRHILFFCRNGSHSVDVSLLRIFSGCAKSATAKAPEARYGVGAMVDELTIGSAARHLQSLQTGGEIRSLQQALIWGAFMKKIAIAVTAVAAFTGSAIAADMPMKAPAAPMVRAVSWTGCYVGAGGGYGMWNQDNQSFLSDGDVLDQVHTNGGRGWFGTGQVGCDYQFAPKWVVGAFGDFDVGDIKGTMTANFEGAWQGNEKERWSWAVGARAGYLPWDTLLVFVSGGFTEARFGQVDFVFTDGTSTGFSTPESNYNGYFLGSGYEYKLDWMPGLFWKTEYRFADYGSKNNPLIETSTGISTGDYVQSHKYVQTIRSELVYHFNMWR